MGAPRHRGNGVHGIGPRHGAARSDRSSGGNVRGVRREGERADDSVRARACCALVGLGLHGRGRFAPSASARRCATRSRKRRDTTLVIPIPPGADSLLRDSLAKRDSSAWRLAQKIRATRSKRRSRTPRCRSKSGSRDACAGLATRFSRPARSRSPICSSAFRASTVYHAGWIAAPASAPTSAICVSIRVFYRRLRDAGRSIRATRGVLDLTQINSGRAEEVVIEQAPRGDSRLPPHLARPQHDGRDADRRQHRRSADESLSRVLRSALRQRRRSAIRRAAVRHHAAVGLRHSSDQLGVDRLASGGRTRDWSVDAFVTRNGRHRGDIFDGDRSSTRSADARVDAHRRVPARRRIGDPDTSLVWGQVMAVASNYRYTGIRTADRRR